MFTFVIHIFEVDGEQIFLTSCREEIIIQYKTLSGLQIVTKVTNSIKLLKYYMEMRFIENMDKHVRSAELADTKRFWILGLLVWANKE